MRKNSTKRNDCFGLIKALRLTFALAVALPVAAVAHGDKAPDHAIHYLGGHLGMNLTRGWPATVDFGGGVHAAGRLSLDRGGHQGLLAGRQTRNARFELEYQRGRMTLTGIALGPVDESAAGRVDYQALTFNAYRTHAFDASWTGFAGAGIGWGKVRLPDARFGNACHCFPEASGGGLVYQLRLGLERAVGDGHRLFAQYTWLSLPSADAGDAPGVAYPRHGVGSVSLGYRKTF